MAITYEVDAFATGDSTVNVTFTDADGLVHKRSVSIPKAEDGSVDQEYLDTILEQQLRGVIEKLKVGAVTFVEPSAMPAT